MTDSTPIPPPRPMWYSKTLKRSLPEYPHPAPPGYMSTGDLVELLKIPVGSLFGVLRRSVPHTDQSLIAVRGPAGHVGVHVQDSQLSTIEAYLATPPQDRTREARNAGLAKARKAKAAKKASKSTELAQVRSANLAKAREASAAARKGKPMSRKITITLTGRQLAVCTLLNLEPCEMVEEAVDAYLQARLRDLKL